MNRAQSEEFRSNKKIVSNLQNKKLQLNKDLQAERHEKQKVHKLLTYCKGKSEIKSEISEKDIEIRKIFEKIRY